MHDAGLHRRLREGGGDRLGKALQPIDDGEQDILGAAGPELVHHAQPELCSFRLLDPEAQHLARAVGQDAQRDVDGLVANEALVADLDPDRVEE
jgi:hypothetical protein